MSSVQRPLPPMELQRVETPVSTARNSLADWRPLVGRSLGRIGWSQKCAALEMGIPETQFSRQLSGQEHLSFWRMHALPVPFWTELVLLIVEFYGLQIGLSELDRRDLESGRALRELVTRVQSR